MKRILCIINPASGKDKPVLAVFNRFIKDRDEAWDLCVWGIHPDPEDFSVYNVVVLYGGDGTITKWLPRLSQPAVLLQGGTGNVIARSLNIPTNLQEGLQLLDEGRVCKIDSFLVNGREAYLRIYSASHVSKLREVDRSTKDKMGVLAYIEACLAGLAFDKYSFSLEVDGGVVRQVEASMMLVTNMSSVGVSRLKFDGRIDPMDGKLDLFVMNDPFTIQREHQACRHIMIKTSRSQLWSIDDDFLETDCLDITVKSASTEVFLPM